MNLWQCRHPGCNVTATGVGGGINLRAIGWFFLPGGPLLCPKHRPDRVPCYQADGEHKGQPCPLCAADQVARWAALLLAEAGERPHAVLQLDIGSVVARLRQVRDEGWENIPDIAERLFTSDLPRLEQHLTDETRQALVDAGSHG